MLSCSSLYDLVSGWPTDVETQGFRLPAGFLSLVARAGVALGPPCYQLPPDVAWCLLFEANQVRTSLLSTVLNRAQLLAL
jgi:hypothetical protein